MNKNPKQPWKVVAAQLSEELSEEIRKVEGLEKELAAALKQIEEQDFLWKGMYEARRAKFNKLKTLAMQSVYKPEHKQYLVKRIREIEDGE